MTTPLSVADNKSAHIPERSYHVFELSVVPELGNEVLSVPNLSKDNMNKLFDSEMGLKNAVVVDQDGTILGAWIDGSPLVLSPYGVLEQLAPSGRQVWMQAIQSAELEQELIYMPVDIIWHESPAHFKVLLMDYAKPEFDIHQFLDDMQVLVENELRFVPDEQGKLGKLWKSMTPAATIDVIDRIAKHYNTATNGNAGKIRKGLLTLLEIQRAKISADFNKNGLYQEPKRNELQFCINLLSNAVAREILTERQASLCILRQIPTLTALNETAKVKIIGNGAVDVERLAELVSRQSIEVDDGDNND